MCAAPSGPCPPRVSWRGCWARLKGGGEARGREEGTGEWGTAALGLQAHRAKIEKKNAEILAETQRQPLHIRTGAALAQRLTATSHARPAALTLLRCALTSGRNQARGGD
jgi:hypothetical protein